MCVSECVYIYIYIYINIFILREQQSRISTNSYIKHDYVTRSCCQLWQASEQSHSRSNSLKCHLRSVLRIDISLNLKPWLTCQGKAPIFGSGSTMKPQTPKLQQARRLGPGHSSWSLDFRVGCLGLRVIQGSAETHASSRNPRLAPTPYLDPRETTFSWVLIMISLYKPLKGRLVNGSSKPCSRTEIPEPGVAEACSNL